MQVSHTCKTYFLLVAVLLYWLWYWSFFCSSLCLEVSDVVCHQFLIYFFVDIFSEWIWNRDVLKLVFLSLKALRSHFSMQTVQDGKLEISVEEIHMKLQIL